MPGNYTHTTRAPGLVLTASIYNTDHQNHIDNQTPAGNDDYSTNVTQMQTVTDPGEVGTESLPTSLAGELERLRFIIKEITGKAQWYASPLASLKIVQIVSTQTGAVATGTIPIPVDDTIPQQSSPIEGDQYMTLAITPKATGNKLRIDVTLALTNDAAGGIQMTVALFQDAIAGALAAVNEQIAAASQPGLFSFSHVMDAGTTSATTFKVRAGGSIAGTTTFNGSAGGRTFGGVMASSIRITEYIP